MNSTYPQRLLVIFCLFALFVLPVNPAIAQETSQTEERTFAEFRNEAIVLNPSSYVHTLKFNLPAHWRLAGDVALDLRFTVLSPAPAEFQGTLAALKLNLNGQTVSEYPIQTGGDLAATLLLSFEQIPPEKMELQLELESYLPDQAGQPPLEVRVHQTSSFRFSYETITPDTSLILFPSQLLQDSIEPDHAFLVIPAQPTIEELRSGLIVAAGLSRLSKGQLHLELVSMDEVAPEMQAGSHLILVGKPEPFLALQGMIFPSPIVVRSDPEWSVQFLLPDRYEFERTAPDDGLIQLINSPWNPSRFILLVSGETDAGVLKAAQAVSSGRLRKNVFPNLAIVKETRITPSASQPDLQPDSASEEIVSTLTLSDHPASFTSDSTLGTTIFVLPRDDVSAWRAATQLAGQLGAAVEGDAINLSASFGDELPSDALSDYNVVIVGRASAFPFLVDLGGFLPVAFEKGKDIPADTGLDIHYRISKDYDSAGYLEILPSPTNEARIILAVLGNDAKGVEWAAYALITPSLRSQLAGNFALINESQVFARDIRPSPVETPAPLPVVTPEEPASAPPAPVVDKLSFWQAGVLFLALIVIIQFILLQRKKK